MYILFFPDGFKATCLNDWIYACIVYITSIIPIISIRNASLTSPVIVQVTDNYFCSQCKQTN